MGRDAIDRRLLNDYQRHFPMTSRPFDTIATELEISESEVIERFKSLRDAGALGRIGAIVRPNTIGASTLAAMQVPSDRLDEVAEVVSAQPEVNHNYEREHPFNLWFVVTAESRADVLKVLSRIETLTGLKALDLPLEQAFHIDLGFRLP